MKVLKRVLLGLLIVALLATLVFVVWAENPLKASAEALTALESDSQVMVTTGNGFISFQPVNGEPITGFVFYPGGRLDYRAYAAPLHQIAAQGYLVILLRVRLNLAFFDLNAADRVLALYPAIKNWATGGHSLGGVAASSYASSHDQVHGLVLWASYPADNSLMGRDIKVLSIYGTLDMAGMGAFDESRALLPSNTEFVIIQGGNHSQFGDYGVQPGDNEATISRADQQQQVVDATVKFLESLSK
jgi:pimeloyl-ACP methyl ester carboxylesterase